MADSKESKTKGEREPTTKGPGDAGSSTDSKPKKRRLGRGLGSLVALPVDIDSGEPRMSGSAAVGTDTPGGVPPIGGRLANLTTPDEPMALKGAAPKGAAPKEKEAPISEGNPTPQGQIQLLEVALIQPNQHQPRMDFDEAALTELAGSIERSGLMQPIVVRSTGNTTGSDAVWEIVVGERRLRAVKLIGRTHVPGIVVEAGEREAAELALIENLQREDLNPLERALALSRLRDNFGLTQKEVADRVGLDRSSIANLIRILELDDFSIAAIRRGALTLGHAKALLSIGDQGLRRATAAAALNGGWSVRELERRVRRVLKPEGEAKAGTEERPITARRANVVDLERRLGEILGMRVQITLGRKKGTGKLQVAFDSLDQFDQLTELLGLGAGESS
jgi:ParB family chromosome partitioning protein